ncbi:MAG: ABC-2 family transporter protein [Fimbriimonadales bacterium]|nr:ABC-2 family transporter protein [Fimbriimonadales bacterium]
MSGFRKSWAIFRIWLLDGLAYRAAAVIWILTDVFPAVIMPLVFISATPPGGTIAGFTAPQFVVYYLGMITVVNFVVSHLMWDLAWEVKEGIFSVNLLRPVSYFQVCFLRNLAWRCLRTVLFLPILPILVGMYHGYLKDAHPYLGWHFWGALLLGHLVSFTLIFMLSLFALFLEETRTVFELYYFPMLFLSGQLFPVNVLPEWATSLAKALPFYYTSGVPTEILVGKLPLEQAGFAMMCQAGWIVLHLLLASVLWRFGLRYYTAVGM